MNGMRITVWLRNPTVLASIIGLLGLCLRLYHLGANSLWFDEGWSVAFASGTPAAILAKTLSSDVHPPTYYLLLHYWTDLFGNSEASLRFPSVLFGTATIFIVFRIATILAGAEIGAIASLLFAVSPIQIQYDTEARMYALLVFAAAIAIWGASRFIDGMTNPGALRTALPLSVGGTILAMASQNTALLLWITLAAAMAIIWILGGRSRSAVRCWLLYNGLVAIAFALWLPYLLHQWKVVQGEATFSPVSFNYLISSLGPLFAPKISEVMQPILASVVAISIAAIALAGVYTWRGSRLGLVFCLLVGSLPIIMSVSISLAIKPIFITRIHLWSLIPLYILIATAVVNLRSDLVRRWVIAVVAIVNGVGLFTLYFVWHTEDWRAAMRNIAAVSAPTDLILISRPSLVMIMDYYARFPRQNIIAIDNPAAIAQATEKTIGHRVWQISTAWYDQVGKASVATALSVNDQRDRTDFYHLLEVSLWIPRAHRQ